MGQQSSATTEIGFIATRTVDTTEVHFTHCLRKQSPSWAKRIISGVTLAAGLSLSLLASGKAEAVSFTFKKIVDTNTPIPSGTRNFEYFDQVSLENRHVAFEGGADFYEAGFSGGIYTYTDGKLSVVADTNTPIPGGTGSFKTFRGISIDNRTVAFSGQKSSYGFTAANDGGIYTYTDGKLNIVVDNANTPPIPTYIELISPSLDNGNVAFLTSDPSDPDSKTGAIYTDIDGNLSLIANGNTPIPGSADNFEDFYPPSLDDGNVAFGGVTSLSYVGTGQYENGIYISIDGKLSVVADFNTPIPGGTGNFGSTGGYSLDNGNVVFSGAGNFDPTDGTTDVDSGIYKYTDGNLSIVFNNNTPIPGGTGTFTSLNNPSLDNGNVAFEGFAGEVAGIYTNIGGSLTEVIAEGELLDSKEVEFVEFDSEGLSGAQVAFTANFTDGSRGIYIATVPEPASVLGTLAFGAFSTGWMLNRRQRKQKLTSHGKHIE